MRENQACNGNMRYTPSGMNASVTFVVNIGVLDIQIPSDSHTP